MWIPLFMLIFAFCVCLLLLPLFSFIFILFVQFYTRASTIKKDSFEWTRREKKIVNKWKYLFMKIYFMSFFSFSISPAASHSLSPFWDNIARDTESSSLSCLPAKKSDFCSSSSSSLVAVFFLPFFLVARSCISLEWHRFEFFMQIEGWWDKNKLYNCRWNGRAAATAAPKKTVIQSRRKKRASKSIFYISQCDRECSVTVTEEEKTQKEHGEYEWLG